MHVEIGINSEEGVGIQERYFNIRNYNKHNGIISKGKNGI